MGLIVVVSGIEWDLIPRPASVRCDLCGSYYAAGQKFMSSAEKFELAVQLRGDGWFVGEDHTAHVCPDCVEGLVENALQR